ncbi:MAG: cytochrome c1, partial [Methylocystis sp.]|nr:cytochrome c1 [Methylocystis sp.]
DGQVSYDDGAPARPAQYAKDIAAFLMWSAEPHLDERKQIGLRVVSFLIVFAGLVYFTKRKIWANVEH